MFSAVKFGWSDALADMEYFFTIPRTIHEAEGEGWHRSERPKGPMKELRMYCPPGRIVCPLYDTAGFIAGLQIAVSNFYLMYKYTDIQKLSVLSKSAVLLTCPKIFGDTKVYKCFIV